MKLSVIIVNYNVEHFLEQCLHSVFKAIEPIDAEVFVVDNNSTDDSVNMVKNKFPQVRLIENKENVGFSKANNQAIRQAKGEYVLLLNPDTVVEADTFSQTVSFMDRTSDAGGLGVKMVNGQGVFLPESKRGLPLPKVAFYKIFGLSKLFKKSHRFGKYHLTYLDPDEIHEVEVLCGAFMLLRKSLLDKIGGLDEEFFMYGEDIDLSYRITQNGYKNYYYPLTRIIHYKGESTKKSSINYVIVFYKAMQIFAKKHFSQTNAKAFNFLIYIAIWLRASFSIFKRIVQKTSVLLFDILFIFGGLFLIGLYWEQMILIPKSSSFSDTFFFIVLPIYTLIWIISIYLSGGYKRHIVLEDIGKGILTGSIVILLIYAVVNENLRFSRAIIVLGTFWVLVITYLFRYVLIKTGFLYSSFSKHHLKRILIIGDLEEAKRVALLLGTIPIQKEFIGFISPENNNQNPTDNKEFIGNFSQLKDIVSVYKINELIFCSASLSIKEIINTMSDFHHLSLEFKIAPLNSSYIIGSNSVNIQGDIYTQLINSIGKKENKYKKRILDIGLALLFLLFYPILMVFVQRKAMFLRNIFLVLAGKKTWVAYHPLSEKTSKKIPPLRKGVLFATDRVHIENYEEEIIDKVNAIYAQDYKIRNDLQIIFKAFKHLGR